MFNYNSIDYTPERILDDELDFFNYLLGIKENQYLFCGLIMEVKDNVLVPAECAARYSAADLCHAVYLTKLKFNRLKK